MSLAADARAAVRADPFVYDALRAGIVNYAALARDLDVDGEQDAIAAALRRFAEELDPPDSVDSSVRVRMESGVEPDDADPVLVAGETGFGIGSGDLTAVIATGEVDPTGLERVLGLLRTHDIDVEAAAVGEAALLVIVDRREGPHTLRVLEDALASRP